MNYLITFGAGALAGLGLGVFFNGKLTGAIKAFETRLGSLEQAIKGKIKI